jgi:hypothetical protein
MSFEPNFQRLLQRKKCKSLVHISKSETCTVIKIFGVLLLKHFIRKKLWKIRYAGFYTKLRVFFPKFQNIIPKFRIFYPKHRVFKPTSRNFGCKFRDYLLPKLQKCQKTRSFNRSWTETGEILEILGENELLCNSIFLFRYQSNPLWKIYRNFW